MVEIKSVSDESLEDDLDVSTGSGLFSTNLLKVIEIKSVSHEFIEENFDVRKDTLGRDDQSGADDRV